MLKERKTESVEAVNNNAPFHGREIRGSKIRIPASHYLVYHFAPKNFVRCAPNGDMLDGFNEVGYVFDDKDAAQQYCHWKIQENPKIGCVVYDENWKVSEQFISSQYLEQEKRARSPQRRRIKGVLFLMVGSFLIWVEAKSNWTLMAGFLIGARLIIGGIVHLMLSVVKAES